MDEESSDSMETVKQGGALKWLVVIAVVLVSVLVVRKNLPETSAKPVSLQPTVPTARQTATPVAGDTREIEVAPGVKMTFVWVAPGSFKMGSDNSDADSDEKPVHQVTLTRGYWIGKYEVTQKEWQSVMGSNPSNFKGDRLPVEQVSWDDCQEYVKKVNDYLSQRGEELRVRLPTEAEWEFAARGGTESRGFKYSGSDNLDEVAWYNGNSGNKTHEVGTKAANELGIHDMSGNVYEWCADWYGSYSSGSVTDPPGPGSGDGRVRRGGCWCDPAGSCRSAGRNRSWPAGRDNDLGVRLASGQ